MAADIILDPTAGVFQERTGASATTVAGNGDPVGTWAASSGADYFVAPSDAARPTLRVSGGITYLEFDGTDDILQSTNAAGYYKFLHGATGAIIANYELPTFTNALYVIFDNCGVSSANHGIAHYVDNRSGTANRAARVFIGRGVGGDYTGSWLAPDYSSTSGWHTLLMRHKVVVTEPEFDQFCCWYDGPVGGTNEADQFANSTNDPTGLLAIGATQAGTFFTDINVGVIKIWNSDLSLSEAETECEGYADSYSIDRYATYREKKMFCLSSTEQTTASDHRAFPNLTKLDDGTRVVVYKASTSHTTYDETWYRTSSTGAKGSWSAAADLFTGGVGSWNSGNVVQAGNGDLVAIADSYAGSSHAAYRKVSTTDFDNFGSAATINFGFTDWTYVEGRTLKLPNDDLLIAAYGQDTGDTVNRWSIKLARSTNDGTTWSSIATIADGETDARKYAEPNLALLSDGTIICSIRNDIAGDQELWESTSSTTDPTTWSTPATTDLNFSGAPRLHVLATDVCVCILRTLSADGNQNVFARRDTDGTWSIDRQIGIDAQYRGVYASFQSSGKEIEFVYAQEETGQDQSALFYCPLASTAVSDTKNLHLSATVFDSPTDQSVFGWEGQYQGGMGTVADTGAGGTDAYEFDGVGDYIDTIGGFGPFDFVQNTHVFTLAFWLKLGSATTRYIFLGNTLTSAGSGWFLSFEYGAGVGTQAIRLGTYGGDGTAYTGYGIRTVDNVITDTNWHHVAIVGNGPFDIDFYVDGSTQSTTVVATDDRLPRRSGLRSLNVGRCNHSSTLLPLDGRMDDVLIFDEAKSQAFIDELYGSGTGRGWVSSAPTLFFNTQVNKRTNTLLLR